MSICPDSNLYSALADGEVPSPWKEKLEAHVKSCAACQKRVARYQNLRSLLRNGAEAMTREKLEESYLKLIARREAALSNHGETRETAEAGAAKPFLRFPGWARASISLPLPALAALIAITVFVPSWFALRAPAESRAKEGYATIIPAIRDAGQSGMKALATSNSVYSPDLPPESISANYLDPKSQQYFTMVEFARQFASDKDLFSEAGGIVIIKLPSLTRFNAKGDPFLESEEPLRQAAGFYR